MTIAERALNKLSELDHNLNVVYETVDAIKGLESAIQASAKESEDTFMRQIEEMDSLYDRAEKEHKQLLKDYETVLSDYADKLSESNDCFREEFEALTGQRNKLDISIRALEQRKQEIDQAIISIIAAYDERLSNIDHALTLLGTKHVDLKALEKKLNKAFSGLDETISNKLSSYASMLDSKLNPTTKAHFDKLSSDIEHFKNQVDKKIDNSLDKQKTKLNDWINTQEVLFGAHYENSENIIKEIKVAQTNLMSQVNDLLSQASVDLNGFRENVSLDVNAFKEDAIANINDKLKRLTDVELQITGFINRSMNDAINRLKETIGLRLDQLEQRQTQFLEHQRALVDGLIQGQNIMEKNHSEATNEIEQIKGLIKTNQSLVERIEALEAKLEAKDKSSIFSWASK